MQKRHVGLPAPVTSILPEEVQDRLPRLPCDPDRWIEQKFVPQCPNAVVEFEVLVRPERFVPSSQLSNEGGRIRAERDVVDGPGPVSEVVRRATDPESGCHRLRDRLPCRCR